MFKTKKDVDKHVADILGRIKNETERNLRGFNIARHYYTVKDHETAKRYLAAFLSVKEMSAPAHKLMAQIYEQCGHMENAVQSYKRSLQLDDKQKDVVLKVCELYCHLHVDPERARFWADKAEKLFPHSEIVFRLRESLINADGEQNTQELEDLITNELLVKPRDINLRMKLLKLYLDTERVKEAYDHAIQVERKKPFPKSLEWCHCLVSVFEAYLKKQNFQYTAPFSQYLLTTLDRLVQLCLDDTREANKENWNMSAASSTALQLFDSHLFKTSQLPKGHQSHAWTAFLDHMQGQLFFHMATIMLKRMKEDHVNIKESGWKGAALLLAAYSFKQQNLLSPWFVEASAEDKGIYKTWHDEACFRLSQSGHVINSLCREDRSKWLGKVREHVSTPQSINKIYQRVFSNQGKKQADSVSFFGNCNLMDIMSTEFPDAKTLEEYDFVAQALHSDSLHHIVWLALQQYNLKDKVQTAYNFTVFNGLPFSTSKLDDPSPESFCLLDVEAFVFATVHCSALALDDTHSTYVNSEIPVFLPANICDKLCTAEQSDWWHAAYCLFAVAPSKNLGDLRRKLQHGIEVIRCIGLHGIDVNLLVHSAQTFADKASDLKTQTDDDEEHANEVSHLEARACLYWRSALVNLERIKKNLPIRVPKECYFPVRGRELSVDEANTLFESGNFYLACQSMNAGNHEAAIAAFEILSSPFASYYQALTFKKSASKEFGNKARESITSEMRSRHIILLTRARDALYVTLDRIRGDKRHPLNQVLPQEIEDIETRLARIDPDTVQRHEFEAASDDSLSTQDSETENSPPLQAQLPMNNSTPLHSRSMSSQMVLPRCSGKLQSSHQHRNAKRHELTPFQTANEHLRPSPERLDSQIRSLASWQDTLINIVVEQNKTILDTNNSILEQLKQNKTVVEKLTTVLEEVHKRILTFPGGSGWRRRRPNRRGQSSEGANMVTNVGNVAQQEHKQPCGNIGGEGDDDEDEENYYDGYYYDEDKDDFGGHDSNFQYNRAYVPQEPPLQNNYPYGQTTVPHGTSTIAYTAAGQLLPNQQSYPPFYMATGAPSVPGSLGVTQLPPPDSGANITQGHGVQNVLPTVVPQAYYNPSPAPMFTGLLFSEGQKLPEFNFSTDSNAADKNVAEKPSVFSRLGVVSSKNDPTIAASQGQSGPAELIVPPHEVTFAGNDSSAGEKSFNTPLQPAALADSSVVTSTKSIVSTNLIANSHQLPTAGQTNANVPHAFQIALPPDAVLIPTPANYTPTVEVSGSRPSSITPSVTITVVSQTKQATVSPSVPRTRRDTTDSSERGSYQEEDLAGPEFKPVIPLPAKVDTKTGEEDELVLFEDRAKLFRFVDKEWKERGIGILKILHNETSGRVRVLMRRDQILKTCANHSILPDIVLTPMKNQEKTWLWVAQDFADEKVQMEKFCAKFKTVDAWQSFKEKFELAKQIANQKVKQSFSTVESEFDKSEKENTVPVSGFGQQFLPKAGSWNCPVCLLNNATENAVCGACSGPKPGTTNVTVVKTDEATNDQKPSFKFGFGMPAANKKDATASNSVQFKFGVPPENSPISGTSPAYKFGFGTSTPLKGTECSPTSSQLTATFTGGEVEESHSRFVFGGVRPSIQPKPSGFIFGASPVHNDSNSKGSSDMKVNLDSETFTLGGFSFKSAPVVKQVNKDDDEPVKDGKNSSSQSVEDTPKINPFAKFSFTTSISSNSLSSKVPSVVSPTVASEDLSFGEPTKEQETCKDFKGKETPTFSPASTRQDIEDFEPTAEFKALVPLPKLIDIKTGEEEERILFGERARLYRYVTETKEWKERGSGEIKLLQHITTGRVRILMRRDRVLKVCANHNITESMKLEPMKTSDRTWIWIANDFSEGEVKQEKFAVKFTSIDMASAFKQAFQEAQHSLATCVSHETTEKVGTLVSPKPIMEVSSTVMDTKINAASKPLSDLFKPKAGSWACSVCFVRNDEEYQACQACQSPNPNKTCSSNPAVAASTFKFGIATTASSATPSGFAFRSPVVSSTTVERNILKSLLSDCPSADPLAVPAQAVIDSNNSSPTEDSVGFRFGTPQEFAFSFGGVRPKSPVKTPKSPVDDSVESVGGHGTEPEESESEGDSIYFHPVIPIPDKVEVKTGEEDEDVLYCQRAKLYRLSEGEWKERGLGDFKILLNAASKKIRLLMRREQILKVCCNHYLKLDMEFCKKDDRSFMWFAADFSDGEIRKEHLAIRFKNSEIAEEFLKAIDQAQERLRTGDTSLSAVSTKSAVSPANFSFKLEDHQNSKNNSPSTSPFTFGNRFSNLGSVSPPVSIFGSMPKSFLSFNSPSSKDKETDVAVISEKKATPQQEEKAAKLLLPPSFYLYEQKAQCPGCRGCEDCSENDDPDISIVWQKNKPPQDKIDKALTLKLPPTFYLYEEMPPCRGCRGCERPILKLGGDESSKSPDVHKKVSFVDVGVKMETKVVDSEEPSMFSKSNVSSISFANLAQQKTRFLTPGSSFEKFAFVGAGATVFRGKTSSSTSKETNDESDDEDDEDDDERDNETSTAHFEPIVQMPSLIEVVTGEEDEENVFCERCKLYRWDAPTKQWKERGVGNMKILKNKESGRMRLLMRRDQIHKVACNHALTEKLNFQPMETSDTSICWYATDFAEGRPQSEKFAARFKNAELMKIFVTKIKKCQLELSSCQNPTSQDLHS